jgi:hypothetical protein
MAERCGCDRHKTGVQGVSPCLREFLKNSCGANSMGLQFFAVPVHDSSAFEQELSGFLARHKVVSIDRHLIDRGSQFVLGDLRRLHQPCGWRDWPHALLPWGPEFFWIDLHLKSPSSVSRLFSLARATAIVSCIFRW